MASMARFFRVFVMAAVLAGISCAATANVVLDVRGGILYGASGVPVGDRLFDVQFVRTNDPLVLIPNLEGFNGLLAMLALLDYALVDSPLGAFDSNPTLVYGASCSVYGYCTIAMAQSYELPGGYVDYLGVTNGPIESLDSLTGGRCVYLPIDNECALYEWAQWSDHVPEPATVPLLLSAGLAWLSLRLRRLHQQVSG
jgi:hypothetical protein